MKRYRRYFIVCMIAMLLIIAAGVFISPTAGLVLIGVYVVTCNPIVAEYTWDKP